MSRPSAILLIGPTGSGKSPLGDALEAAGLHGRRCAHFDFGAQLRRIDATGRPAPGLTDDDVAFIGNVLREGALLENEQFYIARAILEAFVQERELAAGDWIVLNGLPRHVDQARDVDTLVRVQLVVRLECKPQVVRQRIRLDTGGDRSGRQDDSLEEIKNKLAIFHARTLPLIEHYRCRGARIRVIEVGAETQPQEIVARL